MSYWDNSFQSTPSAWRETYALIEAAKKVAISIHSLRMEGDPCRPGCSTERADFNPLPPHGGRLIASVKLFCGQAFQSTPSAWRETQNIQKRFVVLHISIHSLRMEGDFLRFQRF